MVAVDMKMPESCHQCCCFDTTYEECVISSMGIPNRYSYDGSVKPEWCPIKYEINMGIDTLKEK